MLDGMDHLGFEECMDDAMHFAIRRLFAQDDVSKGINDLPPRSSSGISPNLPLVLYHNPDKFLNKLITTIRVHSVHSNYKASASSSGTSNSGTNMQGSLQPGLHGFVLLSQVQSNMEASFTRYPEFSSKGNNDVEQH